MRRRTKRMPRRRAGTYSLILLVLLIANYYYRHSSEEQPAPVAESPAEPNAATPNAKPAIESEKSGNLNDIIEAENLPKWAEVPVMSEREDLYYATHIGQEGRNYTVCFCATHHSPLWVAAPKHPSYRGQSKRTDNYAYDPLLPIDIQPLLKRSYGEYTRGHMLGSAERTASREMNDQAFYSTNIAPQIQKGFNAMGGAWNNIEAFVEKQICSDTLYVVTGAIYERFTDSDGTVIEPRTTLNKNDGKEIGVPTAYYKAMLRTKSGRSSRDVRECRREELRCAAIVVGHRSASGRKPSSKELISIDELERMTGLDLFSAVKSAPEDEVHAEEWGL